MNEIFVILCGTTHPGNVGATARAMKVMGLHSLVLVAPRCEIDETARARASGAIDVLDCAHTVSTLDQALAGVGFVVGTSTRPRRLGPRPLPLRQGAAEFVHELGTGPGAVIFGPERTGLDTRALERCNRLWSIPTAPGYSSLNLAAAVQVVAYELHLAREWPQSVAALPAVAGSEEVGALCEHFERVARQLGFISAAAPDSAWHRVRRLARRARLEPSEVKLLRGFLAAVERSTLIRSRRSGFDANK